MKNKKTFGQIAVIITLLSAIIILFSVVLINLAKISDIKTATSQIADAGALGICSQLSMYGNSLVEKIRSKCSSMTSFCQSCEDTQATGCPNWGLIIPAIGILLAIPLAVFPVTNMIGLILFLSFTNPLLTEVNNIMRGGFNNAAAAMTLYTSIRESSLLSMLQMAQNDPVQVVRRGASDVFEDRTTTPPYETYDLTGQPVAAELKSMNQIPRFTAWYWSKRFHHVSEASLTSQIDTLIQSLLDITELQFWDSQKWMYTETALKVDVAGITCSSSVCPGWVDFNNNRVRIVNEVRLVEPVSIEAVWEWITGASGKGFLPEKFIQLTERLLNTEYASSITYAKQTSAGFFGFFATYDMSEIWKVIEVLRGLMLRDMELLNLPVSARISTLGNWLPLWYNSADQSQTIYGRINEILNGNGEIVGINQWIIELQTIASNVRTVIPQPNGHTRWGIGSPSGSKCNIPPLCCVECCHDCCCMECACNPTDCSFMGNYCSACGGASVPLCANKDLYNADPTYGCPLPDRDPGCCTGCSYSPMCPDACQFQGDQTPSPIIFGDNEIEQAINVLIALRNSLTTLYGELATTLGPNPGGIEYLLNPTDPAVIELQKQAVYAWQDNNGNLNLARVRLDGYPARRDFPYIKETFDWIGFFKNWNIIGNTSGENLNVTVSRYYSDIPAGWWNLRFRKNTASPQFNKTLLSGIVQQIQQSGSVSSSGDLDNLLNNYAITSATSGRYGLRKEDISIQRIQ